ncbi:hypothetical protein JYU34_016349 [Plutella xylostella]|uniref:Uncharacterized protein n=1 Tax=Plutella xylostella TaxID=51655 RepID=A0ABQ7Q2F3_PLUXY|nr:hypothetical protein JYU34_016349 [Plutella xylostella]
MRRARVLVVITFVILVACVSGLRIPDQSLSNDFLDNEHQLLDREKRQMESFDEGDEYPISANQEEDSGFWDSVVKVALKLFNRFIEWLNSS